MTVKSEVQGVVQALFGAYAGGYLAELTAEATANGTGAVAARLASVQGIILGQDLSTNKAFVDTILANMGVTSTNAAYTAASKWATDELTAGTSRGDVVSAAVAFLSGIAAGTIVDTKYAAIASAFAAHVTAGVTYSETAAGAKVLSVAALQTAAGFNGAFNLSEALATVDAAAAAKKAFLDSLDLDANGKLDTAKAPAGDGVSQANQEAAVGTSATTAEDKVGDILNTGYTGKEVANPPIALLEFAGNVQYAGNDYNNGASASIKDSILATEKLKIAADLKDAKEDLVEATKLVASVTGLKNAVDAYNASVAAAKVTQTALNSATAALEAAKVSFDAANTTGTGNVTGVAANVVYDALTYSAVTGQFTARTVTYDILNDDVAPQALFSISATGAVTLSNAQTTITAAEAASLKAAIEANLAALKADGDADALVTARLGTVQTVDMNSVNNNALAGGALAYNNATDNVKAIEKMSAALATAEAAVAAARENPTKLEALNDALEAANDVLTEEGFNVVALADTIIETATAGDDVFTLTALKAVDIIVAPATIVDGAFIDNFGFAGNDVIVATGYTLGGAKGNDAVLEVFVKQVGANAVLTFEESAFGSSATNFETFTVTLTGVAVADVSVSNGYIQLV